MNNVLTGYFKDGAARWLLIGGLAAATLAGHLLTRGIGAAPVIPDVMPAAGGPATGGPATSGVDFAAPGGRSVSFSGKLDRHAVLQGGDGVVKMELVLAAEERTGAGERTPTDFVVVLDRSGSMQGAKMDHARAAIHELISGLSADDRFALVTYASSAERTIPMAPATGMEKQRWYGTITGLRPGGGTNMSAGLDQAVSLTSDWRGNRAKRIILISDGLANEGDPTVEGLSRRARVAARGEAVVTTIGVGADFNEFLMSAVADAGTGNYYYVDDVERLARVFDDELGASRETVASAVAVTVDTAPGVRVVDAAGYPLEHAGGKTVFRPGSLFSGQERRIWLTLEVANEHLGDRPLGNFSATYSDGGVTRVLTFDDAPVIACVGDEQRYHESFDKETWARAAAGEDYGRLQEDVAKLVRSGRRNEALSEIDAYRVHNQRLNLHMKRDEIRKKLEDVSRLATEVEDAFEGEDQRVKQNRLSKSHQAAGRDVRRIGSKKGGGR